MKRGSLAVAFVLVAALGFGAVAMLPSVVSHLSYAAEAGQAAAAREQLETAQDLSSAFQQTAKALRPSVVTISSVQRVERSPLRGGQQFQGRQMPEEFRRFFGDDLERFFEFPQQQGTFEQRGLGSGVIVDAKGLIITNDHVVRDADEVTVTLSDGREFRAEVVGHDAATDIAVLKIDASGLVAAPFGNSDAAEVGQWVLAIGSPMELDQTVTAGIISAKGRANLQIADYEDFIQTDAAINPGNSGGPLVNLRGEVIGINTAIASRTGGNMGIGFAIPANMVRNVMDAIVKEGTVNRGWLGVAIGELDKDLAESFNYDSTDGVLINDVLADGPAAKAGLQAGDIIVSLNGQEVSDVHDLRNDVAALAPGTTAELVVARNGNERTVRVKIGQLTDENLQAAVRSPSSASPSESAEELGLTVMGLTPDLATQLGYEEDVQGVVITEVEPASIAARAGLTAEDVITRVGDTPVKSVADFRRATREVDVEDGVRMQVMRDGVRRFVFLKER